MSISELITPFHLGRKALIYIRQSSPHQVLTNQESQRLQYALRQRARECGWADRRHRGDRRRPRAGPPAPPRAGRDSRRSSPGSPSTRSASSSPTMSPGCHATAPTGIRSSTCAAIAAASSATGTGSTTRPRSTGASSSGLKGQISELELHTIKARLTAGLLNKAQRGELALTLPVGLARDPLGRVVKRPDREVQGRIDLVFATFLRVRSLAKVVRSFNDRGRCSSRDVTASATSSGAARPSPPSARSSRTRPTPGRSSTAGPGSVRTGPDHYPVQKPLPVSEWRIHIRDVYPPYIDWATFEKIQAMIRDNHSEYDRNKTRGVPRPGKALLHGLVYCGECGHKMVVQYKGGTQYLCNSLRQQTQVPVCQRIPGDPIDDHVVRALLRGAGPRGAGRLRPGHGHALRGARAGPAGATAATRTAPLPGATGRAPVPEGRPRQPPGGRRAGDAAGRRRCAS